MWRSGLPSVIAALVMGLGFVQMQRSAEADRRQHRAELAAVQGQLQELSQALAEQSQRDRVPSAAAMGIAGQPSPTAAPIQIPVPVRAEPSSGRPATPPPAPTQRELQARLERVVYSEGADPAWSSQAEQKARTGIQQLLPQSSQLESVHCSASLCRIEITHPSHEELQRFNEQVLFAPQPALWNGAAATALSPDSREGQLISVLYLSREGRSLPGS